MQFKFNYFFQLNGFFQICKSNIVNFFLLTRSSHARFAKLPQNCASISDDMTAERR